MRVTIAPCFSAMPIRRMSMIEVFINGQAEQLPPAASVAELLAGNDEGVVHQQSHH